MKGSKSCRMHSKNDNARSGAISKKRIIHGPPLPPIPNCSMGEYVIDRLRKYRNSTLLIDADTNTSIKGEDLLRESVKLATSFASRGIKPGDRISIISENRLDWMIPACATIFIGAVIAPLNPSYTELELTHLLNISKPRIICVSRRTEELVTKVAQKLPWTIEIIELDDEPVTPGILTCKQLYKSLNQDVDPYRYTSANIGDFAKHPIAILCSSGTTGLPKGVTLSHRNFLILVHEMATSEIYGFNSGDRLLLFLPFYHGYAFTTLFETIAGGACNIITRTFERQQFLENIQKYKITSLTLVPPIFVLLAKDPLVKQYDLSSVQKVICGAAPFPKDLAEDVKRCLPNATIRNAYGMTELSVLANVCLDFEDNVENVGPPVKGYSLKVMNPTTGEILGEREVGELCFKGERVMLGYWDNKEATEQTIDKDGWLRTGDLGYYDEKDQFYIVGRLKELIKYKGYQVAPVEIEDLLLKHPCIKEVAVVGKPDEKAGELPIAFVVRQPNTVVTEGEIKKYVSSQLSPQKWLRGGVKFVNSIPKNPTGKILRKELVKIVSKL